MPRFLFRGAFVRFADLRYDEKSKTTYLKINFTAVFSEPIRKAMDWGEPPAGFSSAKLDGEYVATHLSLTPNGSGLAKQEIELTATEIGDFSLHRVTGEDGESKENELRFQAITSDPDAAKKLRNYLAVVGKGVAQLRVNYEAQSQLEGMGAGEGAEEAEEEAEPTLITKAQAADTAKADEDTASLAPAAAMGGTHQRGARQPRKAHDKVN